MNSLPLAKTQPLETTNEPNSTREVGKHKAKVDLKVFCSNPKDQTNVSHTTDSYGLMPDEIEFLPPILELLERPFSPTLKWVMRILCLAFLTVTLASFFVKTEIYVRSTGEIGSVSGAIPLAVPVGGAVTRVYVDEFDRVEQGSPLFELEKSDQQADIREILLQKERLALTEGRLKAALYHLETGEIPPSGIGTYLKTKITEPHLIEAHNSIFENDIAVFEYSIRALKSKIIATKTRLENMESRNATLVETYSLYESQFARLDNLGTRGYVSLAKSEQAMLTLLATSERMQEIDAQIVDLRHDIDTIELNLRETVNRRRLGLVKGLEQVASERENLNARKEALNARLSEHFITAPFQAIVSRIGENVQSGVIRAGEPAIWLFDATEDLVMHAKISNSDISRVELGQSVRIKINSLDYADFGSLEGQIKTISQVAEQTELGELVYPVTIKLQQTWMEYNGVRHDLIAGMQGQVGVVTGERTLLAWFLAPFETAFSDAFNGK